jgi:hypothetical protein
MMRRFAETAARRGSAALAAASRSRTLRMISSSSSRHVSSSSSTTATNAAAASVGGDTKTASPPPGQRPWCHDTIHRALLDIFASSASASSTSLDNDNNDYVISTNRYELERHGHGESYHLTAPPDFVVAPKTIDEITAVLQIARQYHLPVIPFGAGTSVEGHVQAVRGGISLGASSCSSAMCSVMCLVE